MTGINFCSAFLAEDQMGSAEKLSRVSDMVRHIRYIRNTAGIDVIGLGSDFDGISGNLEINGAGEMGKLADALDREGFPAEEIEKICYRNVLRVYKDVLG